MNSILGNSQNKFKKLSNNSRVSRAKSRIVIFLIMILFGLAAFLGGKFIFLKSDKPPETYLAEIKDKVEQVEEKFNETQENNKNLAENQPETIPEKVFISVPFTSQAPYGQWDEKHEEACEEAAIIILKYYFDQRDLTKEIAEKEIQKMINFEIENYGDYRDSNAEQIVKLAKDFYGIKNLKVIYDFKKEDLKKELARNNPVIVPTSGRKLGNPYYTQPGPLYHLLVLIGYAGNQIITNDPGTRRGAGYRYDLDVLYQAIHDFPGDKNKIDEGRKAMIVIEN